MYKSFIDTSFCQNHFKNRPTNNRDNLYDSGELENWKDINKFLLERSHISFLISEPLKVDEVDENPILRTLYNDYLEGRRTNFEFNKQIEPREINVANNYLSVFFFVDQFSLGFSPSEYGYIIFKSKNVLDKWICNVTNPRKYLITGADLINNALNSWSDFEQFSHVTDCMVIADNYIFADQRNIESNFIPLLKQLIPKSFTSEIQITVFTQTLYPLNFRAKDKVEVPFEKLFKEVNELVKKTFPTLAINLTIIKKSGNQTIIKKLGNQFHDRGIFTRYMRIELSNSIAFFDWNGKKIGPSDVTFTPEPHIKQNGNSTFGDIVRKQLQDLNRIAKGTDCVIQNNVANKLLEIA